VSSIRGRLLRLGLELAGALASALPSGLAYGLADLLGAAWYHFAPARRQLVAANLARVCAASGRPLREAALRRLVRDAFVAHARYYLEVLRFSRYAPAAIDRVLAVPDAPRWESLLRSGGAVAVSGHFGNFEPAAVWVARRGLKWMAPAEEIQPPELFEYLRSQRGARNLGGEIIPLSGSRRRLMDALREGRLVGVAAERDLGGGGQVVTFFGHPARMPVGPAMLAILAQVPLLVATIRRSGRDRFVARIDLVEHEPSGDRRADVTRLTQRVSDLLAAHIAEAPEQWWGSFQPIWDDLAPAADET
jgi:KDO2-lipid IV(A) lauroyltransferase